jgi:chitinase
MMKKLLAALLAPALALTLALTATPASAQIRPQSKAILAGYYPNWGQYSGFKAEDIRYPLYTRIYYAFYKTNANGDLFNSDPSDEKNLLALRDSCKKNNVEIFLSIGGADQSEGFKDLAKAASTRKAFIDNMFKLAKSHGFDGFDIDWEYPREANGADPEKTFPGAPGVDPKYGHPASDVKAAEDLFLDMRKSFDEYNKTAENKIELTAAVPGSDYWARWYTDATFMAMDYLNVMSYDFMGTWEKRVKPNASTKQGWEIVKYYESRGIPKQKLIHGFAFYGKSFNEKKDAKTGKGLPLGLGGEYDGTGSGSGGFQQWRQLLSQLKVTNYEITFDEDWGAEVAIGNQEIIVFNGTKATQHTARSVREKLSEGYPGVMYWDMLCDFGVPDSQSLLVSLYNELYQAKAEPWKYSNGLPQ